MVERIAIHVPGRPKPASLNLSLGIKWGNLLFTAGAVGTDPVTGMTPADIKGQTRQSLENLRGVLEAAGTNFDHVLKTTVYSVDVSEWEAMNEVYREYFSADLPARSAIGIASLVRPECRVEIEVIAVIP